MDLYERWCKSTKEKDKRKHYWTYLEKDGGRDEIRNDLAETIRSHYDRLERIAEDVQRLGYEVASEILRAAMPQTAKGRSGDLPPRPECAPAWHEALLRHMPDLRLVLLVGAYAQRHYLGGALPLTENVRGWRSAPAPFFPLPHPSPRNIAWFQRNPWFEAETLVDLRARVSGLLAPVAA